MPRYTPATGILSFKRRGDDALAGVLLDPGGAPKDWGGSHTGAQLRVLVIPLEPFPCPDGYVPALSASDPLDAMAVAVVEAQGEARTALTELRRRQVQVGDLQARVLELEEELARAVAQVEALEDGA